MISTRGRYALRILIDLALHSDTGYIPMKNAAARQGISLKYLERILPLLSEAGYIEGLHGKGGGYRLCRKPEDIAVGGILRLTEGNDLAPVACLGECDAPCERAASCPTLEMWKGFHTLTKDYFDGITLADLMK